MIDFKVEDLNPREVIMVSETRADSRPALCTSDKPFSSRPRYHMLSDQLHDWCLETIGPRYHKEVAVTEKDRRIQISFVRPAVAMMFKLRWAGK